MTFSTIWVVDNTDDVGKKVGCLTRHRCLGLQEIQVMTPTKCIVCISVEFEEYSDTVVLCCDVVLTRSQSRCIIHNTMKERVNTFFSTTLKCLVVDTDAFRISREWWNFLTQLTSQKSQLVKQPSAHNLQ